MGSQRVRHDWVTNTLSCKHLCISYNLWHRFYYISHFIVEESEVLRKLNILLIWTQTRTHGFLPPDQEHLVIRLCCLEELMIIGTGSKVDTSEYILQITICLIKFLLFFFLGTWLPSWRLNFPDSFAVQNSSVAIFHQWNLSFSDVNNFHLTYLKENCQASISSLSLSQELGKPITQIWSFKQR